MKKQQKKKKKAKEKENLPAKPENLQEDEKKVDYGGLPVRDLKKNLGCG